MILSTKRFFPRTREQIGYNETMRKIVLFLHQSLDGYCATVEGGLDWIPYNEGFEKYAERLVQTVGSPLYGRVTYEMMKIYWPTLLNDPTASTHDREHAAWIENVEKIVFSTTLVTEDWHNTRVISSNVEEEVKKLKEGEGKDLVIFGSPTLARSLMDMHLIDEFRFTVCPVILGKGMTFLRSIEERVNLELLGSETIEGGMVGLHYKVVR
ncbi:MAG: bifunctional deaminase-reductase domain protein [Candidatus Nomurabacteria bacterium]|nr:bifunctional deaminase-reductase domain protein [Candidatus Nomurabacteria bacterium]